MSEIEGYNRCGIPLLRFKVTCRVKAFDPAAYFKMQLRIGNSTGGSDRAYRLPAFDGCAAFDMHTVQMGISRYQSIRMTQKNKIAIAGKAITYIGNRAIRRGRHSRGARGGNIDTIIMQVPRLGPVT